MHKILFFIFIINFSQTLSIESEINNNHDIPVECIYKILDYLPGNSLTLNTIYRYIPVPFEIYYKIVESYFNETLDTIDLSEIYDLINSRFKVIDKNIDHNCFLKNIEKAIYNYIDNNDNFTKLHKLKHEDISFLTKYAYLYYLPNQENIKTLNSLFNITNMTHEQVIKGLKFMETDQFLSLFLSGYTSINFDSEEEDSAYNKIIITLNKKSLKLKTIVQAIEHYHTWYNNKFGKILDSPKMEMQDNISVIVYDPHDSFYNNTCKTKANLIVIISTLDSMKLALQKSNSILRLAEN